MKFPYKMSIHQRSCRNWSWYISVSGWSTPFLLGGRCLGNNESAGKKKIGKTQKLISF